MIPLLLTLSVAQAQDAEWLFVGNSYTGWNDLADHAALWLEATVPNGTEVAPTAVTPGGYTLARHHADAQGTGALATALGSGGPAWHTVVLQDQSQTPGFPQTDAAWIASRDGAVGLAGLAADKGAEVLLFQTWGRKDGDPNNPSLYPDYATMQDRLTEGYAAYAAAIEADGGQAWVAPVGEVWRVVHDTDGAVFEALYSGDGSHPSVSGTLAAAATFVATSTGRLPGPLTAGTLGVDEDTQNLVLAAVDEVVISSPGPAFPWYYTWEDWPADTLISGDWQRPVVHITGEAAGTRIEVGDGRLWLDGGTVVADELVLDDLSELLWTSGDIHSALVQGHLPIPTDGALVIADRSRVEGRVSGTGTIRWSGKLDPGDGQTVLWAATFELDTMQFDLPEGYTWDVYGHELVVTNSASPTDDGDGSGDEKGCGCESAGSSGAWWLLPALVLVRRRR